MDFENVFRLKVLSFNLVETFLIRFWIFCDRIEKVAKKLGDGLVTPKHPIPNF